MDERARTLADISQEIAPDLSRAVERLKAWCATQHDPNPPLDVRHITPDYPMIAYADVRALLRALGELPPARGEVSVEQVRTFLGRAFAELELPPLTAADLRRIGSELRDFAYLHPMRGKIAAWST